MTPLRPAPTAEPSCWRQPAWLTALLLTALIAGWHFYFLLNAGGFWRDEVNLLNLSAHNSLGDLAKDSFPVLMPLLVKFWCALGLGHDDGQLRLLGLSIGLGGLGGLWLAARQAHRSPPLISLALFGLNSTVITFGDSLRAYGLGSLLIIFTAAAALYFLQKASWLRAALLALAASLSVQALFHNAVLVGAICLGASAVCLRQKNWLAGGKVLLAGACAALSLLPYFSNFVGSQASTAVLRTGLSWHRFANDLTIDFGFPEPAYIYVWAFLTLAILTLGIKANVEKKPVATADNQLAAAELRLFASATLLLAAGGFLLFLWLTSMPGQPWYFLPLMALAAVCFDSVFPTLPPLGRRLILVGVGLTALLALPVVKRDLNYRFTNLDAWSQALNAAAKPADFILIVPWFCGLTLDHYYTGTTPWTTIPPLPDHKTHRYDLVRGELQETNVMQPVLGKMRASLQAGQRVWLLAPRGALQIPAPGTPPPADLPPAPLPNTGWADEPYAVVWATQVMQFLSTHSVTFGLVKNSEPSQHIAENMELFLATGWRAENSAPNSDAK